jgi:hypothetical protein
MLREVNGGVIYRDKGILHGTIIAADKYISRRLPWTVQVYPRILHLSVSY